jgi:hypothetical protein
MLKLQLKVKLKQLKILTKEDIYVEIALEKKLTNYLKNLTGNSS